VRAQRIHEWNGPITLEEVPDPRPRDGEVLIDVEACSVGLTVLNSIRGDLGDDQGNLPRIPGHELVGRVVDVGLGVEPLRVGERVMAYFYLFCGRCRRCLDGTEPLCENLAGYVGVHRDGGYGQLCALPDRNAVPLHQELDAALATAIPDAVATPVHVARLAGIEQGERVAVIAAAGGVGVHMVQVACVFGAEVAGLEATDEKLDYLERELGVIAIDSSTFSAAELPPEWAGKADVIVDLLGGPASLEWSARHLAARGRLVLLTTFRNVDFQVSPREFVFGERRVLGSRYASRAELELAAELVASNRVRSIVTRRVPIEEVAQIHEELREGRLLGRGAVVWSQA
jgi:D-arabinose 1-dehydrogenase-like Zn-dependent alcohol dehydrogenase